MKQERATMKQQQLLEFVSSFVAEHDYGPSYREIMRALDYKSVSTVAAHVDGLIAKGFLHRKDKSARSLELVSNSNIQKKPGEASLQAAIGEYKKRGDDEAVATLERAFGLLKDISS